MFPTWLISVTSQDKPKKADSLFVRSSIAVFQRELHEMKVFLWAVQVCRGGGWLIAGIMWLHLSKRQTLQCCCPAPLFLGSALKSLKILSSDEVLPKAPTLLAAYAFAGFVEEALHWGDMSLITTFALVHIMLCFCLFFLFSNPANAQVTSSFHSAGKTDSIRPRCGLEDFTWPLS